MNLPKTNIPKGAFPFEAYSPEWYKANSIMREQYYKPEAKMARASAVMNGIPDDTRLLTLTRAISISRESYQSKIKLLNRLAEQDKTDEKAAEFVKSIPAELANEKEWLKRLEARLGKLVAIRLLSGEDLTSEFKKVQKLLASTFIDLMNPLEIYKPRPNNRKSDLKGRMLRALDELRKEWYPQTSSMLWLITKAALRKKVLGDNPSDHEIKQFRTNLKSLGLSALPEAIAGRKKS